MTHTTAPHAPRMTAAEFLDWGDGTDTRYELVEGRIVAMAPPSPQHSAIAGNITVALGPRLKPPCRVVIEYGIPLAHDDRSYYQADLAVLCAEIKRGEPPPEPIAVIEVVSPTSFGHDRFQKSRDYRQLAACQLLLLVDSVHRHVEVWIREGDRWIVQDHIGNAGPIPLVPLDATLDLAEVYEGVDV